MKKIFLIACILFAPAAMAADEGCGGNCVPKPECESLGYKLKKDITCVDGYITCPFDKGYIWCRQYKCEDGALSDIDKPENGKMCVPVSFHGLNCFDCNQDKICKWTEYNKGDYAKLSDECEKGTYGKCEVDYVNVMKKYKEEYEKAIFVLPENATANDQITIASCGQSIPFYTQWQCNTGFKETANASVYSNFMSSPVSFIREENSTSIIGTSFSCEPESCPEGYDTLANLADCDESDFQPINQFSGNDQCGYCRQGYSSCEEANCCALGKACQKIYDAQIGEYWTCRAYETCAEVYDENCEKTYVPRNECNSDYFNFVDTINVQDNTCGRCVAKACEDLDGGLADDQFLSYHTDQNDSYCSKNDVICSEIKDTKKTGQTCYQLAKKFNFKIKNATVNATLGRCDESHVGTPCQFDLIYQIYHTTETGSGSTQRAEKGSVIQSIDASGTETRVVSGQIQEDSGTATYKGPQDVNPVGIDILVSASFKVCSEEGICSDRSGENSFVSGVSVDALHAYDKNNQQKEEAIQTDITGRYVASLGLEGESVEAEASMELKTCDEIGQGFGKSYYTKPTTGQYLTTIKLENEKSCPAYFEVRDSNGTATGSDGQCYTMYDCRSCENDQKNDGINSYYNSADDPHCTATGYKCTAVKSRLRCWSTGACGGYYDLTCYRLDCKEGYLPNSDGYCELAQCTQRGDSYVLSTTTRYLEYQTDMYLLEEVVTSDTSGQCYKISCNTGYHPTDNNGTHYYMWDSENYKCVEKPVCISVMTDSTITDFTITDITVGHEKTMDKDSATLVNGAYIWGNGKNSYCRKHSASTQYFSADNAFAYIGDTIRIEAETNNNNRPVYYRVKDFACANSPAGHINVTDDGDKYNEFILTNQYHITSYVSSDQCSYMMAFYITTADMNSCEFQDGDISDKGLNSYHSTSTCHDNPVGDGYVCTPVEGTNCYKYTCDDGYDATNGHCCPKNENYIDGRCTSLQCEELTLDNGAYVCDSPYISGQSYASHANSLAAYTHHNSTVSAVIPGCGYCRKVSCVNATQTNGEKGKNMRCIYPCTGDNEIGKDDAHRSHYKTSEISASISWVDESASCYKKTGCADRNTRVGSGTEIECECDTANKYFGENSMCLPSDRGSVEHGCWRPNCRSGTGYFVADGTCGTCNDCPAHGICDGADITDCDEGYTLEGDICTPVKNDFFLFTNVVGVEAQVCDNANCDGELQITLEGNFVNPSGDCNVNKCADLGTADGDCVGEGQKYSSATHKLDYGTTYWFRIKKPVSECNGPLPYNKSSIECDSNCTLDSSPTDTEDYYVYKMTPRMAEIVNGERRTGATIIPPASW